MSKTLFDKVWDNHVIVGNEGDAQLLYIDLHLMHEVTSPQAFSGLRLAGRKLRRPDLCIATMDHNTPTIMEDRRNITDEVSKNQLDALERNCKEFGVELIDMFDDRNGIVHIVGPELGLTQPGKTVVCGDSHTATHGAFGAIAFGIGTSEVEHVMATQSIWQKKPKQLGVKLSGKLSKGVHAKDIILSFIAKNGVGVGNGYAIEFFGDTVSDLSMEERMTICNMAIEAGAKYGIMAPDQKTFDYIEGREKAPKGEKFAEAVEVWKELYTDDFTFFDKVIEMDCSALKPQVTWGTSPEMGGDVDGEFPESDSAVYAGAYEYMGLKPGMKASDIPLKHVWIGSCTNGRLSDLEVVAEIVKGKKVHPNINAIIVPGSQVIKKQCEENGMADIFKEAGFEWREAGCSSCLGMNPDLFPEGEHIASTSNRNFEGRQGKGSRTHLCSPAMAAYAAVDGRFRDISEGGM